MEITRRSTLTGKVHTLDVPVTVKQMLDWEEGMLIQHAMPDLSAEYREFLLSGITPDEWDNLWEGDE